MSIEPEQIESVKITASLAEQQPKAVSVQPKALDVFSPRPQSYGRDVLFVVICSVFRCNAFASPYLNRPLWESKLPTYSALTSHTIKQTNNMVPSSPYPNIVASLL